MCIKGKVMDYLRPGISIVKLWKEKKECWKKTFEGKEWNS
jgi:hypothetical protein